MSYRSKYDKFWTENIDRLIRSIETAYTAGNAIVDISDISEYGRRSKDSWYGKIIICKDKVVKGNVMVHLKSLGRILLRNNLLKKYDCCFSFTVSKNLMLVVKRLDNLNLIRSNTLFKFRISKEERAKKTLRFNVVKSSMFRDKPLGPKCICDDILKDFLWHELSALRASDLPNKPGVYVIRVIDRGEDLVNAKLKLSKIVMDTGWNELIKYVESRLVRLLRIKSCPLIYIGSTDSIKSRFKDLAGIRHTAFFPILALLLSRWRLDYGFKTASSKKEAAYLEEELKAKYRENDIEIFIIKA